MAASSTTSGEMQRIRRAAVEADLPSGYATDSVGFVLAGSEGLPSQPQVAWAAERISAFLAAKGSASRRDLVVDCFGRHQPAAVVDAAIAHLMDCAPADIRIEVQARSRIGSGRPATIYRLVKPRGSN